MVDIKDILTSITTVNNINIYFDNGNNMKRMITLYKDSCEKFSDDLLSVDLKYCKVIDINVDDLSTLNIVVVKKDNEGS